MPQSNTKVRGERILAGISGGPAGFVAASLLKSQGFEVIGVHLRIESPFPSHCAHARDLAQIREISASLDLPLTVVEASDVFEAEVVDPYVQSVLSQRRPNPCARCHPRIKIGELFRIAKEKNCERVVTGHFAQVLPDLASQRVRLTVAVDKVVDQSYLLMYLSTDQLSHLLTPLGGIQSTMVDRLAREFKIPGGLQVKPQSAWGCVELNEDLNRFIEDRSAESLRFNGLARNDKEVVFGEHKGLHRHWIGQGGLYSANPKDDHVVIGFDLVNKVLKIGKTPDLKRLSFLASGAKWLAQVDGIREFKCQVKLDMARDPIPCLVSLFENDMIQVRFEEAQGPIVPGQRSVFYEGEEVLGGASIDRSV